MGKGQAVQHNSVCKQKKKQTQVTTTNYPCFELIVLLIFLKYIFVLEIITNKTLETNFTCPPDHQEYNLLALGICTQVFSRPVFFISRLFFHPVCLEANVLCRIVDSGTRVHKILLSLE